MTHPPRPRFGIMTAPMQVGYHEILRVWREADTIPEIEHAWLFDHLMPIGGDPDGPIFEGWTLLSALAAQTERLRLGLLQPGSTPRRTPGRLSAHRSRAAGAFPGPCCPVGRRRAHRRMGLRLAVLAAGCACGKGVPATAVARENRRGDT